MTESAPAGRPRLLLVAAPGEAKRSDELRRLFGFDFAVQVAGATLPDPRAFAAVVVDGAGGFAESEFLRGLGESVEQGCRLLVLLPARPLPRRWAEWLGADSGEAHPRGEWFLKPLSNLGPIAARLPAEIALVDAPVELAITAGGAEPLAAISIGFKDRVVMSRRPLGRGEIVLTGIGAESDALSHEEVVRLLRRAVRPLSSPDRPLGFGVLGYGPYGGMGLYHGVAARQTEGLEMVAAADPDPSRREAAEVEFPGLRAHAGVEGLAADDAVDVVVVATPPVSHFDLARRLFEAGKHVVLEKPMCLKVSEADELLALARRAGRTLTVHQSRRWDPDFQLLARSVAQGLIGDLFNVETFVGGFEHPCRAWHSEVEISGGAVYDWGSHHLDWILQLMGEFPAELTAHGHKRVWRDVTNLDQVRVRLAWADGREAEFLQSDIAAIRRPKFFLQGTAGTIAGSYRPLLFERLEPGYGYVGDPAHHAEAPVELTLARYTPGEGLSETVLRPLAGDRYGFHRNLADHLHLGEPLAVTPESAREVVALLEAAQVSTDKGNVSVQLVRPGA